MTREEIDTLWQQALHDSVVAGETFTRYHFANLIIEECAKIVDEWYHSLASEPEMLEIAQEIRARKSK